VAHAPNLVAPAGMSRYALPESNSPRSHHEWAKTMWDRMDRDHGGTITRQELDCEEFRSVIRAVLTGSTNTGGALYSRSAMNMDQCMHFILRKADLSGDGILDFKEFKSFMWMLRNQTLGKHTANLIFSLFDVDGDQVLTEKEFREVYRFYLGHNPTEKDFKEEWNKLDDDRNGTVPREEYIRWLQTSTNPIFKQHAPPVEDGEDLWASSSGSRKVKEDPFMPRMRSRSTVRDRPKWNQKWNQPINCNKVLPQGERAYFSKSSSLPELTRFYESHRGFRLQRTALAAAPSPQHKNVLSTDCGPVLLPRRHAPGGTMRHQATGKSMQWEDQWQTPPAAKSRFSPGSLDFRHAGTPPKHIVAGMWREGMG